MSRTAAATGIKRYWREVTATQANVEVRIGRTIVHGDRALVE